MKFFGKIDSQFWTDKDLRSVSQNARYLALYLPSCSHGDMLGIFKLPFIYATADLQWDKAQLIEALQELADIEYLTFNEECEFVCLNEFQQSTPPTNSNQVAARVKLLEHLPVIDLDISRPIDLLLSFALSFKNSEEYQKRIKRVRERFDKSQQSQSTREKEEIREGVPKTENDNDQTIGCSDEHTLALMNRVKHIEPKHFDHWWAAYPKGEVEREDKQTGLLFYKVAMYRGYTETELHTVLEHYVQYCRQTNKLGTRYVHKPSSFLSEDDHLQSLWESYPEMY